MIFVGQYFCFGIQQEKQDKKRYLREIILLIIKYLIFYFHFVSVNISL